MKYPNRKCDICGAEYAPLAPNQKYCSCECRRAAERSLKREQRRLNKDPCRMTITESRKERKARQRHLEETIKAADAAGMSYGRYVQMIEPPKGKNVPLIFIVKGSVKPNEIKP